MKANELTTKANECKTDISHEKTVALYLAVGHIASGYGRFCLVLYFVE